MNNTKKNCLIIITSAYLVLLQSSASTLYSDVTVLSSDDQGITIEFNPRFLGDEKIQSEQEEYLLPRFENGFRTITSETGAEDIRARVINIALPGYQGNTVTVLASDYESVANYSLAPVPTIKSSGSMSAFEKIYSPHFISGLTYYPREIAWLENVAWIKGVIVGNIVVTPYQYQASSKTLRKYSRIVVRIEYGRKENVFANSYNDEWARAFLLNYHTAKKWMTQLAFRKITASDSKFASGTWFKVEIIEDGMYKIDASYLRSLGVEPSSLSSITDVKVFGADGKRIPENVTDPRPADLPQISVYYYDQNGNTKFDDTDYLLFYGQGITGWTYAANKTFRHYTNPYTNSNYYFIAIKAGEPVAAIQEITVSGTTTGVVDRTIGKVFFDEEKVNFNQSGQNWVSAPFNAGESRVISNKLHGWIEGTPISYYAFLYSRANVESFFKIEESGTQISSTRFFAMSDETLGGSESLYANPGQAQYTGVMSISDSRSNLKFTYTANSNVASGYIDWFEILYQRRLTAVDNEIIFTSPDSSGVVEYRVNGFDGSVSVYDVTNVNAVVKLTHQMTDVAGTILFKDSLSANRVKKYWIGTAAKYRYPKSFVKLPNSNLRGYGGAEFIIITHNEFKSEALRLKAHKESLPKAISTVVVDIDTIYNEFGIGMPDPAAVRDFVKFAVDNWAIKPGYLLFFGDASYDFKSIYGNDKSWVPTYEVSESNIKIASYNNEDFFAYLAGSGVVAIAHGRLCPRSASDAAFLVDRIISYETKQFPGPWKNTITVVGDDVWTAVNTGEEEHTRQAESLATVYTPKSFEVKKIYLGEYATQFASSGRRKPDARQAIIDQVNKGTLLINYTGHGNPKVWAHESILTFDDVKTQFTNADRLTFVVAATCDWGRFDEAGEQSSAEEIVLNRRGGAIGVFSATRAVYSSPNFEINYRLYQSLFSPAVPVRLGDAVMQAKNNSGSLTNKQKYFLLGDPTLVLAIPSLPLTVDSINNKPATILDTLHSLDKVTITASVRDTNGSIATNYNATALVTVYDADRLRPYTEMTGYYRENGAIIYRGENSIINGQMKVTFIVPKDIAYENKNGRISIYLWNNNTDGRGFTTNFIVGGTNELAPSDSIGPELSIFFNSLSFRSGDVVPENPTLIVELKDANGINSSNNAVGHRIEAWIDDSPRSIDLTEHYKGKIDSYQEGRVEYQLTNIPAGRHIVRVKGWDVYNNSTNAESHFVVAAGEGLSIHNVYNFPNPVTTTTIFTFQHNRPEPIDVTIKIYTVAGRLIRTIEERGGEQFARILWDRRDADGDEVGNGIYLYKVIAKTIDGKYSSEAIGKMAVVR